MWVRVPLSAPLPPFCACPQDIKLWLRSFRKVSISDYLLCYARVAQLVEHQTFQTEGEDVFPRSDNVLNTHFQGKITELQVAESFLAKGYQVSQPLVADSRYDFIVDIRGKLYKIQVKTCHLGGENEYIEFATSSSHTNTQRTINHSYSKDEIDYFATFYEGQCYVVPVEKCGSRGQRLRIKPTRNGQVKGIMFAKDYRLEDIFTE